MHGEDVGGFGAGMADCTRVRIIGHYRCHVLLSQTAYPHRTVRLFGNYSALIVDVYDVGSADLRWLYTVTDSSKVYRKVAYLVKDFIAGVPRGTVVLMLRWVLPTCEGLEGEVFSA